MAGEDSDEEGAPTRPGGADSAAITPEPTAPAKGKPAAKKGKKK